jgi:hypothetical protein
MDWHRAWVIAGILTVAAGLRFASAVWWQARLPDARSFAFPDSLSYWELGGRIAEGRPYEFGGPDFRVFRAPGYPILLAGLFRVVGTDPPVLWARGLGAVLGTLTVAGLIWVGWLVLDARSGMVTGCLAAVYPGAVGLSVFVLSEALFCLWMVLQLGCWVAAWQSSTVRRATMWGIASGLMGAWAILTRPSWLLFTPLVMGLVLLTGPDRGRQLRIAAVILVAMTLAMLPWWLRNYRAVGHFVPTTLQVGASLYDGLNPRATGASDMEFVERFFVAQKAEDAREGRSPEGFELRLDRRQRDAALRWVVEHPGEALGLVGPKFRRMWGIWPNAEELRGGTQRRIIACGYLPVLALGLVGLGRWGRQGWPFLLAYFPAVYFTALHLVFVSSLRYREPAMLMWLVLAGGVLALWLTAIGQWWSSRTSGGETRPDRVRSNAG